MSDRLKYNLLLGAVLLTAVVVFTTGVRWGLPTRATDEFLFGSRTPWTGKEILALAPAWNDATRGADVDANPLVKSRQPIVLNATDADRAEIVRRYRLFSYQPDEMITFRALSGMNPGAGKLDPRLYQYGGLWVYPVGALLKIASIFHVVTLTPDLAFYLDHPEEFGNFYVVARLYSAAWGVIGGWTVYWLGRRATGSAWLGIVGAVCFTFMPVVVNMAHEAKPHLPGAVLLLLACAAASKYVETGRRAWWIGTGALCGAALGMVLSSLWAFAVIPVMAFARPGTWSERGRVMTLSTLVGVLVYCLTNPYVPFNAIFHPDMLRSNVGNSTAMYGVSVGGVMNAFGLISTAGGVGVVLFGLVGWVVWIMRRRKERELAPQVVGFVLLAPALLTAAQFVALAAGKPAEYARFAIVPVTVLLIGMLVLAKVLRNVRVAMALLVASQVFLGLLYVAAFVADAQPETSRLRAARVIVNEVHGTLRISAEPAPYVLPPVNLFDRPLVLDPTSPDVLLKPDTLLQAPIGWANKSFEVVKRSQDALPAR